MCVYIYIYIYPGGTRVNKSFKLSYRSCAVKKLFDMQTCIACITNIRKKLTVPAFSTSFECRAKRNYLGIHIHVSILCLLVCLIVEIISFFFSPFFFVVSHFYSACAPQITRIYMKMVDEIIFYALTILNRY